MQERLSSGLYFRFFAWLRGIIPAFFKTLSRDTPTSAAAKAMITRSIGYRKVMTCHVPIQLSALAVRASRVREPAIWPASVEVREVMKKP